MESKQQNASTKPPLTDAPTTQRTRRKGLLIGIIIVAAALVAIILFLLFGGNRFVTQLFLGPRFTVGQHPYVYACSSFSRDDLVDVLGLPKEISDEFIREDSALNFAKRDTDLLQLTGSDYVTSSCTYNLNTQTSANNQTTSDNIETYLTQYKDNKAASDSVAGLKPKDGTKELPSLKGKGNNYFYKDSAKRTAEASFIKDNVEVYARYIPQKTDVSDDELLQKLDAIIVKAVQKIENGDALKPSNFNGLAKLGGKGIVDTCKTVDAQQLASVMGDVEFNQSFAQRYFIFYAGKNVKEEVDKKLQATCSLDFRTKSDIAAQQGKEIPADPQTQKSGYDRRFIQGVTTASTLHASSEGAKKALETVRTNFKKPTADGQARAPLETVKLGDDASKSHQQNDKTGAATTNYYVQKGQYLYFITVFTNKQQEPFVSEGYDMTDETAGKIVNLLEAATK